MIVIKTWEIYSYKKRKTKAYFGVFILGIIPIFIKRSIK